MISMVRTAWATTLGLALLGAEVPGPAPRLDAWRVVGPGGGGTMRRPAISPHDPRVVVEGCDMTGSYLTRDAGTSWRMFNLGWVVDSFAFDPKDPNVIYAATGALWRSEDAGRTWAMVFPDPARNAVEHGWGDHADIVYTTEDPLYPSGLDVTIHTVAVDPADSRRLFVALSATLPGPPGSSPSGRTVVLGSEDRGRTWSKLTELAVERVFAISADRAVHVLAETGAYEGAAGAWQRFAAPGGTSFQSGSIARADSRTLLYATTAAGIHVSEDGGRNWRSASGALAPLVRETGEGMTWGPAAGSKPSVGPIAASANHGLTAYVGLRGVRPAGGGPAFNGIARTSDGGRSWTIVHSEADRPSTNLEGSWIEARALEDGHSVWFDAPYDLAVAPGDPNVCYATDLFRTYRTQDGGRTWIEVNSAPRGADRWVSRGLDVTSSYGVHWDPFDSKRVFITYTDIGLFRSDDGGASWTGSSRGVPRSWRNTTYWIAFDPEVRGLVWGAFSGTHDLPRPKMWRRTDPDRFQGGIGISEDGGRSWTPSNTGMPETAVTHVLVDPTSPRGRRTLYATGFGRGVFKSTDNGRTWALKNDGIEQRQPFAWRITRAPDGTLYLIVARRSERGRIGDADDGALYRSTDGAEHWLRMPLPPGTNGPNGLAVDPGDARRLYLAAWGVATPGGDTGGGIFVSSDGGTTWKNVLPESQHVYDVTIDPRHASVLYACGFDRSAFRSTDRGATWARLRGFNFKWGHRVIPDQNDPDRVYVTTFGGSVWHGPATGDPTAVEDVVDTNRLERLVEANIVGTHAYQLKDIYRFYIRLGLPVYVGQFGLPGSDADLLAAGRQLEGRSCVSPVGTSAAEWQIAGRKIWNWGEKNLHIRDASVLAAELLAEPEIVSLVPRIRALPPQRVAVIGHSFTMDLHWSSPSSFVPIVTAMFARENPRVEFRQFQGGGLTSTRADNRFFQDALGWKPDTVLLVVLNRTDEDLENFAKLGRGLAAGGARVYAFDDVHDPDTSDPARLAKEASAGRAAGITMVEVGARLAAAPDRGCFVCLDGIHMTEPYHRLMAKEWLKLLVGARGAGLER